MSLTLLTEGLSKKRLLHTMPTPAFQYCYKKLGIWIIIYRIISVHSVGLTGGRHVTCANSVCWFRIASGLMRTKTTHCQIKQQLRGSLCTTTRWCLHVISLTNTTTSRSSNVLPEQIKRAEHSKIVLFSPA